MQDLIRHIAQNLLRASSPTEARNQALARAKIFSDHRPAFMEMLNAAGDNNIDAALKRAAILQTVVTDFARRLLPLQAFATVFSDVPLQGLDTIEIPFYDLDGTASTSWNGAVGYVAGTTTTGKREITVDRRKYQGLQFTSQEIARQ